MKKTGKRGKAGSKELTPVQKKAMQCITASIEENQRPPTIREMMAALGHKSTGSARDVIAALQKKGYVEKTASISRGLKLADDKYRVVVETV